MADEKASAPTIDKETAREIGKGAAEAVLVSQGKGPVQRTVNQFKAGTPSVCPPGFAVIADANGQNPKLTELFHVCGATSPAVSIHPENLGARLPMKPAGLMDSIKGRQIVVLHYTPYPETRNDGGLCITGGALTYPHKYMQGGFESVGDSYYNKAFQSASAAKAEAQKGREKK